MRTERIHDRSHCHGCVELSRETDADRNSSLVLDLLAANPDVVPGIGLHIDAVPKIGAVIDWVRNEAVGEGEIFLGFGVVSALHSEIDRLAMLFLTFGVDIRKIGNLFFINRWRR